jgi:hypothetical protein
LKAAADTCARIASLSWRSATRPSKRPAWHGSEQATTLARGASTPDGPSAQRGGFQCGQVPGATPMWTFAGEISAR